MDNFGPRSRLAQRISRQSACTCEILNLKFLAIAKCNVLKTQILNFLEVGSAMLDLEPGRKEPMHTSTSHVQMGIIGDGPYRAIVPMVGHGLG